MKNRKQTMFQCRQPGYNQAVFEPQTWRRKSPLISYDRGDIEHVHKLFRQCLEAPLHCYRRQCLHSRPRTSPCRPCRCCSDWYRARSVGCILWCSPGFYRRLCLCFSEGYRRYGAAFPNCKPLGSLSARCATSAVDTSSFFCAAALALHLHQYRIPRWWLTPGKLLVAERVSATKSCLTLRDSRHWCTLT